MARKLVVEIVGDSKSYERALGRSATATNQFGQALGTTSPKLGKAAALTQAAGTSTLFMAGAAAGLATAIGAKSVQAASDLNEEMSKSIQVFGDSAAAVKTWSETTAEGMGISQVEALRATGTFGALFKTLDFGEQQNADLSRSLVQLASDMASFNNANPEDVLLALRSGLTGEAEPLRRFGVFLSEARTQQLALTQSGKASIRQLTNQEKVFARYSIIMRDTTSAQGDFERTSGSLANQQRVLEANLANTAAGIGGVLIPFMVKATGAANKLFGALSNLGGVEIFGREANLPSLVGWIGGWKEIEFLVDHSAFAADKLKTTIETTDFSKLPIGTLPSGATPAFPSPLPPTPPPKEKLGPFAALEARAERERIARIIAGITRRAAAQDDFNKQLALSEQRAEHLKDLIRADPDNAKLQQRLTNELGKQSTLRKQIASAAEAQATADKAAAKAIQDQLLATFDLAAARAGLTKSLQDDLAAAKAREATLIRLVALNRQDVDLANQLVSATEERRDIERQIADAQRERVKARQFKALGLTAEGLKPTPGAGSLLKRATGLQQQIKGTVLDTAKNRSQLKTIVNFLKKNFNKAGKDVRAAILAMLNDISNAFEGKDAKTGPLTKGHGLNMNKIIEGMGLTPEQERELRGRLGGISAGATRTNAPGTGGKPDRRAGRGGEGFFVESHTTINIDGKRVASVVTNNQQKAKRRNPQQKRGQHRS